MFIEMWMLIVAVVVFGIVVFQVSKKRFDNGYREGLITGTMDGIQGLLVNMWKDNIIDIDPVSKRIVKFDADKGRQGVLKILDPEGKIREIT